MIEIVKTTLPNGVEGNCGYLELEETTTLTNADKVPIKGLKHTFSFYAKADSEKVVTLTQGFMDNTPITDTINTEWKKVKLTFTSDGDAIAFQLPQGQYYLYQGKWEEGTIATTWTASQKDAEDEILNLKTEIRVTAEGLSSKVSKNEIISEINQSAEEVRINADKIKLEGFVSINGTFMVDKDGYLRAVGGTIGGFNIENNYLSSYVSGQEFSDTTLMELSATDGIRQVAFDKNRGKGYTSARLYQENEIRPDGNYIRYSKLDFRQLSFADYNTYSTLLLDGKDGTITTLSGTITGSDKDIKKDIKQLDINTSAEFIYSLIPSEFRYRNNTSDRLHHGFIAQEVKEAMKDNDWGLYVDTSINSQQDNAYKALRYEELIADLVATVQSQNERIIALEKVINNL